jgi:HSP20 family molecular chaperone IbpA
VVAPERLAGHSEDHLKILLDGEIVWVSGEGEGANDQAHAYARRLFNLFRRRVRLLDGNKVAWDSEERRGTTD